MLTLPWLMTADKVEWQDNKNFNNQILLVLKLEYYGKLAFMSPGHQQCAIWIFFSSILSWDFWRFKSDFQCFCELSQEKYIVEDIESIKGTSAERSSPSRVCIQQKSFVIAHDFWNTNSLGWTPFAWAPVPMMDSLCPPWEWIQSRCQSVKELCKMHFKLFQKNRAGQWSLIVA